MPKSQEPITLADSIAALREQLEIASRRRLSSETDDNTGLVPPLKVTEIVLETEVVTNYDEKLGGKLNYWIATVDGSKTRLRGAKQTVRIKLLPTEIPNPATGKTKSLELGRGGRDVV